MATDVWESWKVIVHTFEVLHTSCKEALAASSYPYGKDKVEDTWQALAFMATSTFDDEYDAEH